MTSPGNKLTSKLSDSKLSFSFFHFFIGGIFLLSILIVKKDLSGVGKLIKNNWVLLIIASCFALGISNII